MSTTTSKRWYRSSRGSALLFSFEPWLVSCSRASISVPGSALLSRGRLVVVNAMVYAEMRLKVEEKSLDDCEGVWVTAYCPRYPAEFTASVISCARTTNETARYEPRKKLHIHSLQKFADYIESHLIGLQKLDLKSNFCSGNTLP